MAEDSGATGKRPIIIIRREESGEGGHHGGAWKVAYADFVTAMMAFFLLMWLLNATTEEQRKGLADYFAPTNVFSHSSSGSGQPFGGHTAFDKGAMVSDRGAVQVTEGRAPILPEIEDDDSGITAKPRPERRENGQERLDAEEAAATVAGDGGRSGNAARQSARAGPRAPAGAAKLAGEDAASDGAAQLDVGINGRLGTEPSDRAERSRPPSAAELRAEQERREKQSFEQAAEQIRAAVRADPALAELTRQLAIDMTPEGLRIQILDEDRSPMFATGSTTPNERARLLVQKVTPVLMRLPEGIAIAGHTDATPYRGTDRTNWELSAERANATRRLLVEAGLPEGRIRNVTGNADRDPLLPADPAAAANRRIAIVVLRAAPSAVPTDSPVGSVEPVPQRSPRAGAAAIPHAPLTAVPEPAASAPGSPRPAAPGKGTP